MPRHSIYDDYRRANGGGYRTSNDDKVRTFDDDDRDDELEKPKPAPRPRTETLSASVGDAGTNDRKDVAKVEKMLGKTGDLDLKQTDGPTGYWGMRTSDATKRFQKKNKLKVDAQINPSGPTLKKLGEAVAAKLRQAQSKKNDQPKPNRHPGAGRGPSGEVDSGLRRNDPRRNLTPDAASANARAARYLASRRGIGDYSTFVADGIEMNPTQGIAEAADLIEQTRAKSPKQADELFKKTLDGLSDGNARSLIQALAEKDAPETDEPDTPPPDPGQDDPEEPEEPKAPDEPNEPERPKDSIPGKDDPCSEEWWNAQAAWQRRGELYHAVLDKQNEIAELTQAIEEAERLMMSDFLVTPSTPSPNTRRKNPGRLGWMIDGAQALDRSRTIQQRREEVRRLKAALATAKNELRTLKKELERADLIAKRRNEVLESCRRQSVD